MSIVCKVQVQSTQPHVSFTLSGGKERRGKELASLPHHHALAQDDTSLMRRFPALISSVGLYLLGCYKYDG